MRPIAHVVPALPGTAPGREEVAGAGDASNWSLDWRQAFEQARHVEYADWFGTGTPAPSEPPPPAPMPEAGNAFLAASLRQSLQPAPAPAPAERADAGPVTAPAEAEPAVAVRAAAAVDRADAQPGRTPIGMAGEDEPAAPARGASVSAAAGAVPASATGAAPAGSTPAAVPTARPAMALASNAVRTMERADATGNGPAASAIAADAAAAAMPVAAAGSIALAAGSAPTAALMALVAPSIDEPPPPVVQSAAAPHTLEFAVDAAHVDAEDARAAHDEAVETPVALKSASRTAPAAAEVAEDAPRVHTEWSDDGVKIWLGVDADAALPGQLEALLAQLHPLLAAHGEPLAELFCNGRSVWRATARLDDVPAVRRMHDIDLHSLVSDLTPKEAS